jgi:hypothetical protein
MTEERHDPQLVEGFVSLPIPGGGSYTLTTYLGDFLRIAESQMGLRDSRWTILGVEFFGWERDGAVPHTWYPGNCGNIAIRLTRDVARQQPRAIFQLAHEVVHLISPSGKSNMALNLEEGFATVLGHQIALAFANFRCPVAPRYKSAYDDVRILLAKNPSAIKEIRQIEPKLWMATPQIIDQAVPGIEEGLAERLCRNWYQAAPRF